MLSSFRLRTYRRRTVASLSVLPTRRTASRFRRTHQRDAEPPSESRFARRRCGSPERTVVRRRANRAASSWFLRQHSARPAAASILRRPSNAQNITTILPVSRALRDRLRALPTSRGTRPRSDLGSGTTQSPFRHLHVPPPRRAAPPDEEEICCSIHAARRSSPLRVDLPHVQRNPGMDRAVKVASRSRACHRRSSSARSTGAEGRRESARNGAARSSSLRRSSVYRRPAGRRRFAAANDSPKQTFARLAQNSVRRLPRNDSEIGDAARIISIGRQPA